MSAALPAFCKRRRWTYALGFMACWFAANVGAQPVLANDAAETPPAASQTGETVLQSDARVMEEAPAQLIASLYQVSSHATGLALQNAVHSQQALNQISSAVVAKAVALIMAIGE